MQGTISEIILGLIAGITAMGTGYISYMTKTRTVKMSAEFKNDFKILTDTVSRLKTEVFSIKQQVELLSIDNDVENSIKLFLNACNDIIADSVKYTDNTFLKDYIIYKATKIRNAAANMISANPKISDINIDYIRNTISQITTESLEKCKLYLGEDFYKITKSSGERLIIELENNLLYLIKDEKNNKLRRYYSLIENYLIESLALNVREYNKYISEREKNNIKK